MVSRKVRRVVSFRILAGIPATSPETNDGAKQKKGLPAEPGGPEREAP